MPSQSSTYLPPLDRSSTLYREEQARIAVERLKGAREKGGREERLSGDAGMHSLLARFPNLAQDRGPSVPNQLPGHLSQPLAPLSRPRLSDRVLDVPVEPRRESRPANGSPAPAPLARRRTHLI